MAAPEDAGSPAEAPQPAVEEEETKTFKDLVRVVLSGLQAPGAAEACGLRSRLVNTSSGA